MNAYTRQAYAETKNQYRIALSLWSECRILFAPGHAEIVRATKHLDDLEQKLRDLTSEPETSSPVGASRLR